SAEWEPKRRPVQRACLNPKDPSRHSIGVLNDSVEADDDDSIGVPLDDIPEPRLAFLEGGLASVDVPPSRRQLVFGRPSGGQGNNRLFVPSRISAHVFKRERECPFTRHKAKPI